ncbi:hypothetical protein [Pseudomonas gregormendelii]
MAVLYKPMEREEQSESGQPVLDENGSAQGHSLWHSPDAFPVQHRANGGARNAQ